jgi:glucosamine kinase
METRTEVVLAGDIGGTSTKLALADLDGEILVEWVGPGGNLRSSGGSLRTVLAAGLGALVATLPDRCGVPGVVAAHLGVAGAGGARHADIVAEVAGGLSSFEGLIHVDPVVATDLSIALHAIDDPAPDGIVLLAGTGAVASRFERGRLVDRVDGMGWLLGDEGSAVWIGRTALLAAAAELDRRGPATALTAAVQDELGILLQDVPGAADRTGGADDPRQRLIQAVDPLRPADLGRFAPLVTGAAEAGDEVALGIVAAAAAALARDVALLDPQGACTVVIAGSVLTSPGPMRERVTALLGPDRVRVAEKPLLGAVRLALEQLANR